MFDAGGGGICVDGVGSLAGGGVVRDDTGGGGIVEHDGAVLDFDDRDDDRDCCCRCCRCAADGWRRGWICRTIYDGQVARCNAQLYRWFVPDQRDGVGGGDAESCGAGAEGFEWAMKKGCP